MVEGCGAGSPHRLALFLYSSASGNPVVKGSQLFTRFFCAPLFPVLVLAGSRTTVKAPFRTIAVGFSHSYLRIDCSGVGRTRGGAFSIKSVIVAGNRGTGDFLSGMGFHAGGVIPLGFLAADDSASDNHIQPDHFSSPTPRIQGCSRNTPAGRGPSIARGQHY